MSRCRSVGSRPDVDEPISASGRAAASIWVITPRFSSSRSGTLSCTQSASATASSSVLQNVTFPFGGSGAVVSMP